MEVNPVHSFKAVCLVPVNYSIQTKVWITVFWSALCPAGYQRGWPRAAPSLEGVPQIKGDLSCCNVLVVCALKWSLDHLESLVWQQKLILEDVGVWLLELLNSNSDVLTHCSVSGFLLGSVIPRALWGREPKSFSRWERMRLSFALLVSLEPTAKGQCFQTAAQSLLLLDLSRSAPG